MYGLLLLLLFILLLQMMMMMMNGLLLLFYYFIIIITKRVEEPIGVGLEGESPMLKSVKDFRFLILREISHKTMCIPCSSGLIGLI
jgi:hypothetical protein